MARFLKSGQEGHNTSTISAWAWDKYVGFANAVCYNGQISLIMCSRLTKLLNDLTTIEMLHHIWS